MSRLLYRLRYGTMLQAYPPAGHYSKPAVYHGIRRLWTLGVAATGGSCGSSPQGDRSWYMYFAFMDAVPFLYPEIGSIRDFNTYACSTVALGKAQGTGGGFGGQSRNRTGNLPLCFGCACL